MKVRRIIQFYFLCFYLVAGYLFHSLIESTLNGGTAEFSLRYPAIETFLPLSALVGLNQLISTGVFDQIHTAGLTILLLAIFSSLILGRGICSHICPIGTLSELLNYWRNKIIKIHITVPQILHYLLMIPKYALLLFFLKVILIDMSGANATAFTHSSYNIVSDAKMLNFFLNPSALTIEVLVILVTMTFLIPFFWCRYLCPYGALLNIPALFSPLQIRRKNSLCDSCGICDQQCHYNIPISNSTKIISPDCTRCHKCTISCPNGALSLYNRLTASTLKPAYYSTALIVLFTVGILAAKLSGYWQSTLLPVLWVKYLPLATAIPHP